MTFVITINYNKCNLFSYYIDGWQHDTKKKTWGRACVSEISAEALEMERAVAKCGTAAVARVQNRYGEPYMASTF